MKKRSPFLPAFLAIFSIASIGIIYGQTTKQSEASNKNTGSKAVTAELIDVSGTQLLEWMTENDIPYVNEQTEEDEPAPDKYSVYFEHAQASDIVGAVSAALGTDWYLEGSIYVLKPSFEPDQVQGQKTPMPPKPKQIALPFKGTRPSADAVEQSFGARMMATMTGKQLQQQTKEGFVSTESLSDDQKELLASEIDTKEVNMIIASQGQLIHLKGEI